jgi:outer membrane protein TolC
MAGLHKAQAGLAVSQATLDGVRQDLALRVVQVYADWLGAYFKIQAFEKSLKAHQPLQQQIERHIAGGASPHRDLTLLLGRAQQTEADLSAAQAQSQSALGRLSQMLGRPLQPQLLAQSIHAPIGLGSKARDILVKPGMTASIDIRTGTRSVLSYLAKPVFKAFGGALIER